MTCCSSSTGMRPKYLEDLSLKLKEITIFIPSIYFAVILSSNGEVVSFENSKLSKPQNLLGPISSVKKAALQFASTLSQTECPIIHIRGNNTMFSCYDLDNHILVCCSEMHSAALDTFNVSEVENSMEPITESLKMMVRNLVTQTI